MLDRLHGSGEARLRDLEQLEHIASGYATRRESSVASLTSAQFSVISGGVAGLVGVALVLRFFPALMSCDAQAACPGA